jgi:hypothetical protein
MDSIYGFGSGFTMSDSMLASGSVITSSAIFPPRGCYRRMEAMRLYPAVSTLPATPRCLGRPDPKQLQPVHELYKWPEWDDRPQFFQAIGCMLSSFASSAPTIAAASDADPPSARTTNRPCQSPCSWVLAASPDTTHPLVAYLQFGGAIFIVGDDQVITALEPAIVFKGVASVGGRFGY